MDYTHRLELLWDAHKLLDSTTAALDDLERLKAGDQRKADRGDLKAIRDQLRIAMAHTEEMVRDIAALAS